MTDKKPYREGDDPEGVGQLGAAQTPPEGGDKPSEDPQEIEVAFIVCKFKNGNTGVITDIQGFPAERLATLTDIRDLSHSAYSDVSATILARKSSREVASAIRQSQLAAAMEEQARKSPILVPSGVPVRCS